MRPGLPSFQLVGLPDAAIREARERVRAALLNSGFEFPPRRITVNLAPSHLRKAGSSFDLAIAAAVLAASGQIPAEDLDRFGFLGEISLSGEMRPARGAVAVAEAAANAGLEALVVSEKSALEADLVPGMRAIPLALLRRLPAVLRGDVEAIEPCAAGDDALPEAELADVRGQSLAVRAAIVAAAGGHNLLLAGPPGCGKTMIARRIAAILPPLDDHEALDVTRVMSITGLLATPRLVRRRPFRAPHHTVSASGLVGGGVPPRPGEVTLAHRGVLFLDELAEFRSQALEALRQPLEDGVVQVTRGQMTEIFPAKCMLVAATNLCPCGLDDRRCCCSASQIERYRQRLSGPLLDRFAISCRLAPPPPSDIAKPSLTTVEARERIAAAQRFAEQRDGSAEGINLEPVAGAALARAYATGILTLRGRSRVLDVARTVADLDASLQVERRHVDEALALRGVSLNNRAAA